MKRKYIFIFLAIAAVFVFFSVDAEAQCAMCRKAAESKNASGTVIGRGLNPAILYLMGIPYVILFFIFRKQIMGFLRQRRAKAKA
jgi:hypothetical protein